MATFGQIPSNDELITGTNVTLGGLNLASLYPDPGVDKPASLKVTQRGAGANMSVDVAAGSVYVPDGSSGINLISKASTTNLAVSNGAGGGIRHDFVTVDSSGTLAVLEGTVGSDPTPASNTHVLARIRVPQNETISIDDADIDDKREYGTVFRRGRGRVGYSASNTALTNVANDTRVLEISSLTLETDRRYHQEVNGFQSGQDTNFSYNAYTMDDGAITGHWSLLLNGTTDTDETHPVTIISQELVGDGSAHILDVELDFRGNSDWKGRTVHYVFDDGGLERPNGSEGQ